MPPLVNRVVEQILVAEEAGDRAGHDDGTAVLHFRNRGLRHVEITVEVRLEGAVEVLFRQVL